MCIHSLYSNPQMFNDITRGNNPGCEYGHRSLKFCGLKIKLLQAGPLALMQRKDVCSCYSLSRTVLTSFILPRGSGNSSV